MSAIYNNIFEHYDFSSQTDAVRNLINGGCNEFAMQILIFIVGTGCMKSQNDEMANKILEMDAKNKELGKLNKAMGDLQSIKAKYPADTKATDPVTIPSTMRADLADVGINIDDIKTYGDLSSQIEALRGRIDQLNSLSQADATKLQLCVNQSQVYSDMTTNSLQTFFTSLKGIMRNLA